MTPGPWAEAAPQGVSHRSHVLPVLGVPQPWFLPPSSAGNYKCILAFVQVPPSELRWARAPWKSSSSYSTKMSHGGAGALAGRKRAQSTTAFADGTELPGGCGVTHSSCTKVCFQTNSTPRAEFMSWLGVVMLPWLVLPALCPCGDMCTHRWSAVQFQR